MWGKPPFTIAVNCALDVKDLDASLAWYKEKLKLHELKLRREDDSQRPFVDLGTSGDAVLTLLQFERGESPSKEHVVFFAENLDKSREWFAAQGITASEISSDSGGNRFFHFYDLDGNAIKVCIEP